ncbi:MAG: FecR domain-containing protein [Acidiferrobacteraceae bacterium]
MRLRRIVPLATLLVLPHVALANDVGIFSEVDGDVTILRGDTYYQAATGVDVNEQDIIETGKQGSAQLDLEDGSSLRIAGNSRVLLSDYQLREDGNVVRATVDVLTGWLRFAVSKLHGHSSYGFNTPVMTIGIRGTQGIIQADTGDGSLMLEEGHVRVHGIDEEGNEKPGEEAVDAGQYLSRQRGRMFARRAGAPAGFWSRLPARMKLRLVRRAQLLKRHGIQPRPIRRMQRRDMLRYLHNHPAMKWRLRRRFQARWKDDPEFRKAFARHRRDVRERRQNWRERRRVHRHLVD